MIHTKLMEILANFIEKKLYTRQDIYKFITYHLGISYSKNDKTIEIGNKIKLIHNKVIDYETPIVNFEINELVKQNDSSICLFCAKCYYEYIQQRDYKPCPIVELLKTDINKCNKVAAMVLVIPTSLDGYINTHKYFGKQFTISSNIIKLLKNEIDANTILEYCSNELNENIIDALINVVKSFYTGFISLGDCNSYMLLTDMIIKLLINYSTSHDEEFDFHYLFDYNCKLVWCNKKITNTNGYSNHTKLYFLAFYALKKIYIPMIKHLKTTYGNTSASLDTVIKLINVNNFNYIIGPLIRYAYTSDFCYDDISDTLIDIFVVAYKIAPLDTLITPELIEFFFKLSTLGQFTNNYDIISCAIDIIDMHKMQKNREDRYVNNIIKLLAYIEPKAAYDEFIIRIKGKMLSFLVIGLTKFVPSINNVFVELRKETINLLNSFVSDLHYHYEYINNNIKQLKMNTYNLEFNSLMIKSSYSTVKNFFTLLVLLTKYNELNKIINDRLLINDICVIINILVNIISKVLEFDKDIYMQKITSVISVIFELINNIYKTNNTFINHLPLDTNYSEENYKNILQYYIENNANEEDVIFQMIELVDNIKVIKTTNYDIDDVPEEFLDPLTFLPIEQPYILPETLTIVDKLSIYKHLLTKQENPFTRSPLNEEVLEKFNQTEEIQAKIQEFINKFETWKTNFTK